jgi:hypothetical protein
MRESSSTKLQKNHFSFSLSSKIFCVLLQKIQLTMIVVCYIFLIFATSNYETMEEKHNPQIDEEQGIDMCCEPIAEPMLDNAVSTSKRADGVTEVHDWIDDLDWDRLPILGPKTEEEAIARIERFEERLAKGEVKWYSSEEVDNMLYERYPWLR